MDHDVVIVGGGPAALMVAEALAARDLSVVVLADRDVPWTPRYGLWADEADALGFADDVAQRWPIASVVVDDHERLDLARGYATLDGEALRQRLRTACLGHGATVHDVRAAKAVHADDHSEVTDATGAVHRARLVIDASGHRPAFVRRSGAPTMFQAAYGVNATPEGGPWRRERMTFMDLRTDHVADEHGTAAPTFLYAMPFDDGSVFVEETSMIRAPALPFGVLERRLAHRMAHLGVTLSDVRGEERCLIPMDPPLPDLDQRVVGFGAAASFVHPATGYSVVRSALAAPRLAEAVAAGIAEGRRPGDVARDAWRAVWTPEDLRRRQLLLYGARIVAGLDADDGRAFYRSFFSMPRALWAGYLGSQGSVADLMTSMASMFSHSSLRTRWQLLRSGAALPGALLGSVAS